MGGEFVLTGYSPARGIPYGPHRSRPGGEVERPGVQCSPELLSRLARAAPDLQHKIEAFLEVQGA